jgi:hypothetical protein
LVEIFGATGGTGFAPLDCDPDAILFPLPFFALDGARALVHVGCADGADR